MGAEVLVVPRNEFNHGTTRELARHVLGTDIVVMMTPDARPQSPDLLTNLVRPILQGVASMAYARQVPHEGAKFFEAFPRSFNYPDRGEIRSIEDVARLGPGAFFCSNVCAAWLNSALDEIGGFSPSLSLEDVIATARLLYAGHRIAYCADAVVAHSHRYSLAQEFRRHFDTGYVRAQQRRLLFTDGGDERRGAAYGMTMMRRLVRERPWLVPYGVAHLVTKYAGYRAGYHGHRLPRGIKRNLSGQDYYWQGWASRADAAVIQPQPHVIT
jgi:rhamnosyltransferase